MKGKIYYHWWNWKKPDEYSLVIHVKELGWLEYFEDGFFSCYRSKKELLDTNKCSYVFKYIGEV